MVNEEMEYHPAGSQLQILHKDCLYDQSDIYRCKVDRQNISKELIILKDELDVWDHPMSKLRPSGIIKILTSLQCTLDLVMYFNQLNAGDHKQVLFKLIVLYLSYSVNFKILVINIAYHPIVDHTLTWGPIISL